MKPFILTLACSMALLVSACSRNAVAAPEATPDTPMSAAQFTSKGELVLPENLENWVFLGSSLGMGYSNVDFNPETPGNFQIVSMEPAAFEAFKRTGAFPDGAMFALSFYGAKSGHSINEAGFTMDELRLTEIHLKDAERFPETGFNFYMFEPGKTRAPALPLPNDCVTCHMKDAEHDSVFTQFYPVIQTYLNQQTGEER